MHYGGRCLKMHQRSHHDWNTKAALEVSVKEFQWPPNGAEFLPCQIHTPMKHQQEGRGRGSERDRLDAFVGGTGSSTTDESTHE